MASTTLAHQPAKIAAMEGHYESYPDGRVPLTLFGWPDDNQETVHYAVEIPLLGSLILTQDLTMPLKGLKDFPPEDRPPATLIFWTFRIMVAMGFAELGVGLWSALASWKEQIFEAKWLHCAAFFMGPSGFLAVLCGWITTEVGRQHPAGRRTRPQGGLDMIFRLYIDLGGSDCHCCAGLCLP